MSGPPPGIALPHPTLLSLRWPEDGHISTSFHSCNVHQETWLATVRFRFTSVHQRTWFSTVLTAACSYTNSIRPILSITRPTRPSLADGAWSHDTMARGLVRSFGGILDDTQGGKLPADPLHHAAPRQGTLVVVRDCPFTGTSA